ncbi:MAG: glycosyltransferase family 39 protein, partial [Chloroflexota bacterium]
LLNQTWVINAFLAMLTVALVYRIGYEVFSPDVGVFAAFLTAFSPAALLLNGSLMSHTFGLFLATLFIYAYWRLQNSPRPHLWGIIAGIALGSSAATRPLTTLATRFDCAGFDVAQFGWLRCLPAGADGK